ncbi:hypothetical protein G7054_g3531 [Neopestalotiopsis clavispora]|nr:hypothetical protein E8E14_007305 [Neopestalotiopsis sp. 37M]KAF7537662.1 hypothetical protein G7054_g3531 [Neopestalotiopsis clavispora]
MCTQTYLKFACCPCQLRFCFTECQYGPADPRCRHVKKEFVWAASDFCHHHQWCLKQSSAWHAQQIQRQVYHRIKSSSSAESTTTDASPSRPADANGWSSPLA